MPITAIEACKADLYSSIEDLMAKYPRELAEKVVRIRDMHQIMVAKPETGQREIVTEIMKRYGVSERCAYNDMAMVKEMLPALTESKKAFHRWRANEMLLETYRKAKAKNDLRTMEKTASSYAKFNRVDQEDEKDLPYAQIVIQPFVPTMDPTVLGLPRIENLEARQKALIEKYSAESADIEDISYEDADLEEDSLFAPPTP